MGRRSAAKLLSKDDARRIASAQSIFMTLEIYDEAGVSDFGRLNLQLLFALRVGAPYAVWDGRAIMRLTTMAAMPASTALAIGDFRMSVI